MKKIIYYTLGLALSGAALASPHNTFTEYHSGKFQESAKSMAQLAKSGNKEALFYLANMYMHGYGVDKDFANGLKLMTQAGKLNYLPALLFLGKYYYLNKKNIAEALPWFKRAAEKGNTQAQLFVIIAYSNGYGTKQNFDKARWSIIQAAKNGNAMAQYELARMFLESKYYTSRKLGKIWLSKSARQGFQKAIAFKQIIDNFDIRKRYKPEKTDETQLKSNDPSKFALMQKALKEAGGSFIVSTPVTVENGTRMTTPKLTHLTKEMITQPDYKMLSPQALSLAKISTKMLKLAYLKQKPVLTFPEAPFVMPKEAKNYDEALTLLQKRSVYGDPTVLYKLGQMYAYGLGVKKDNAKALKYFMAAADQNYLLAQYEVGVFYLKGKAVPVNTDTALSWFTRAALRGSPEAQFVLGTIYEFGINSPGESGYIKRNVYQAKALYSVSALFNIAEAKYRLAQLYASGMLNPKNNFSIERKNQIKAYKLYQHAVKQGREEAVLGLAYLAAAQGKDKAVLKQLFKKIELLAAEDNSSAQLLLAILYDRGIGVDENRDDAVDILQVLAEKGNSTAQFMLGTYEYLDEEDKEKAILWLKKSADQNNPYALYNLAILVKKGEYHPEGETFLSLLKLSQKYNYSGASLLLADHYFSEDLSNTTLKEAVNIYKKLAQKQNATAQLKLGFMYQHGIYFSKNQKESFKYYQAAANNQNPIAQYLLARQYQSGIGVAKNTMKAISYFKKSADQQYTPAIIALGYSYEIYLHDYAKSLKLYLQASEKKSPVAYYNLGNLYQYGKGTEKSLSEAFGWYQEAANKGYLYGELKLAQMYMKGLGVGKNPKQAIEWLEKAANKDNAFALYQLGTMYESGFGCDINLEKSKLYYERAAKLGYSQAQLALARLNKNNSEQEIKAYKEAANKSSFAAYRLAVLTGKKKNSNLKFCAPTTPGDKNSLLGKLGNLFSSSPRQVYKHALDTLNQGKVASGTTLLRKISKLHPDFTEAKKTLEYYLCAPAPVETKTAEAKQPEQPKKKLTKQ